MTMWVKELDNIRTLLEQGMKLEKIGKKYNVTRQRIYQVLTKYNIETPEKNRKSTLRGKEPKYHWLDRMLRAKKVSKSLRIYLVDNLEVPDVCPALGITLNYDGQETSGWTRTDNSPSIDRIDSNKGYELGNIQILSWRANRIKNDSTPEELMKIAKYIESLQNIA
jgi:hypothetical protein